MVARGTLLALLLAAGCGSDESPVAPTPAPPPEPPTAPEPGPFVLPDDPEALFLEVWRSPGFVPVEFALGRPPLHAVSVGGELFFEVPAPEIWPGPILPDIRHARLSEAELSGVIAAVRASGLPGLDSLAIGQPADRPMLADIPTVEVILRGRDGSHRVSVAGLGIVRHSDPRVPPLAELVDRLAALAASADASAWTGDRVQVYASGTPRLPEDAILNLLPWPLPDPPPEEEEEFTCLRYEGEVATDLLAVLAAANHGTRWDYGGELRQLLARPLLPREEPCLR